MMHLTRLLFILLLSGGLWSSLAAKTALPEVEVTYKTIVNSPQETQAELAPTNSKILLTDCRSYSVGYADGVCASMGGCTSRTWNAWFIVTLYRCTKNIQ